MFKLKKIIFLITILIVIADQTQAIKCVLRKTTCTFNGLRTTEANSRFYPASKDNSAVEKINFINSTMHTLTDELCRNFRNIRELDISNLKITNIISNPLRHCKQLSILNMSMNDFGQLNHELFEENYKLSKLDLKNNKLKVIPTQTFDNMPRLSYLNLGGNFLTEFPVQNFPVHNRMKCLLLYSNNITDLDEKGLLQNFPNLKQININNNLFECDRLTIIVRKLKSSGIEIQTWVEQTHRNRGFDTSTVEGIECIAEEKLQNDGKPEIQTGSFNWFTVLILVIVIIIVILFILYILFQRKHGSPVEQTTEQLINQDEI